MSATKVKEKKLSQQEIYRRWLDFSTRMAERAFNITPERRSKLVGLIESFLVPYEEVRRLPKNWDGETDERGDLIGDVYDHYADLHPMDDRFVSRTKLGHMYLFDMFECCIRAGFDVARGYCGGVAGFTIKDINRMYNHKIPQWVKKVTGIKGKEEADMGVWL